MSLLIHGLSRVSNSLSKPLTGQIGKRFFASEASAQEVGGLFGKSPWDVNNRIRVIGSGITMITFVGLVFDTLYNRATKKELNEKSDALDKKIDVKFDVLDKKIDALDKKFDAKIDALGSKIDNLAIALIGVEQREKISYREENSHLKQKNEELQRLLEIETQKGKS
jgi:hypothetical protein